MKTILVPTDYSKEARSALWYALEMALVSKADIVLFHAFHHPVFSPFPYDEEVLQQELECQKLIKLKRYALEAAKSFCTYYMLLSGAPVNAIAKAETSGSTGSAVSIYLNDEKVVTVEVVCKYGLAEEEIVAAASLYGADLFVMGMRGAGSISQALLGSTTLAVMQDSQVPVLAVPLQVRFSGLASVVLAVNPEKLPVEETLAPLRDLAATFNSQLAVLQLFKNQTEHEAQAHKLNACHKMNTCLQETNYRLYASRVEDVAAGIGQFLEAKQADLLVLLPQRHSFLSRLRNRSITGQMASKALVPLLALPCATTKKQVRQQELVTV